MLVNAKGVVESRPVETSGVQGQNWIVTNGLKAGDKVITRQPLGIVQTNEEDDKTELHLEVWRGSNKMDPENWIAAKR